MEKTGVTEGPEKGGRGRGRGEEGTMYRAPTARDYGWWLGGDGALEASCELIVFLADGLGEAVGEFGEEVFGVVHFGFPVFGIDTEQLVEGFVGDFEAVEGEGVYGGDVADGGFLG